MENLEGGMMGEDQEKDFIITAKGLVRVRDE